MYDTPGGNSVNCKLMNGNTSYYERKSTDKGGYNVGLKEHGEPIRRVSPRAYRIDSNPFQGQRPNHTAERDARIEAHKKRVQRKG